MVSTEKTKILLDAGVKLGVKEEHPIISDKMLREIDGIFVSHSHLDHSGYLPHIYSAGYTGKVYSTKPTIEIINVLISDYMRISNPSNVTKEGLARLRKGYEIVNFDKDLRFKDLTIRFLYSGHIVGSSMISVSKGTDTLLYSGDVHLNKTRLLEGAETKNLAAKTLIIESTYGGRKDIFPPDSEISRKMHNSIKETLNQGGKVLIPALAVGRAQEVLLMLDDYMNSGQLPKVPIYVDGMINKTLRIHRHNVVDCRKELQRKILMSDYDPFKSSNFVAVEAKSQRNKIVNDEQSSIIVTTSGMLNGGPVLFYLSKIAGNSLNKMILVSYQAEGTLGRRIQEGDRKVKINGSTVDVQMTIDNSHFSAHADRPQLISLIQKIHGLKNVFVIHGEKSKSEELRADLAHKYHAIVPKVGEEYEV